MIFGIILGAWAYSLDGKKGVAITIITVCILTFIDLMWGTEVGLYLGKETVELIK